MGGVRHLQLQRMRACPCSVFPPLPSSPPGARGALRPRGPARNPESNARRAGTRRTNRDALRPRRLFDGSRLRQSGTLKLRSLKNGSGAGLAERPRKRVPAAFCGGPGANANRREATKPGLAERPSCASQQGETFDSGFRVRPRGLERTPRPRGRGWEWGKYRAKTSRHPLQLQVTHSSHRSRVPAVDPTPRNAACSGPLYALPHRRTRRDGHVHAVLRPRRRVSCLALGLWAAAQHPRRPALRVPVVEPLPRLGAVAALRLAPLHPPGRSSSGRCCSAGWPSSPTRPTC